MTDSTFQPPPMSLGALFLRFLRFGCLAFGGPVAQIAMIRRELVEQERWISGERFNRLLAVMQALPGPEAHELCVHLGMRARGRIGGLLAGLGFMLPGFVLMTLAAWLYFRFDIAEGALAPALLGAQAAAVALVARASQRIGAHVLSARALWTLAILAAVATLAGAPFWLLLPAAGAVHLLVNAGRRGEALVLVAVVAVTAVVLRTTGLGAGGPGAAAGPLAAATLGALFLAGLKGGLLTFGGAYTAIPFVRQDVVGPGWVRDGTFLDGVALANVLPAPLVIFATFSGFAAGGFAGAVAITIGMFLPAFAFSLTLYDRLEAVVSAPRVHAALDGVAAAVVGVIVATLVSLAASLLSEAGDRAWIVAGLGAGALGALFVLKGRFAAPLVLLAAAVLGLFMLGG
ncbi:chromate efflux transporter [Brevundimonas sp. Root1279]|uniref:chromate efflux transporter n=1 Tax=Brevundimonas sp. Root1279 TaxID=1736443 RepID=UPI000701B27D|nr:chromate efflux transporter [Brevundimonas sp. Root1279]KQW83860.1 chromate transporter [Brevundimonas sp. Root1279]